MVVGSPHIRKHWGHCRQGPDIQTCCSLDTHLLRYRGPSTHTHLAFSHPGINIQTGILFPSYRTHRHTVTLDVHAGHSPAHMVTQTHTYQRALMC